MAPHFFKALTAATALYASLATALPVKRAVVYETVTDVVVKTVTRTTTVKGVPGPDYTVPPVYSSPSVPVVQTSTPVANKPQETPVDSPSAPPAPTSTPAPPVPTPSSTTPVAVPTTPPATSTPPPPPTTTPPPPPPTTTPPPPPPPAPTSSVPPVVSVPPVMGGGDSSYSGPCAAGAACLGEITFYDGGVGSCGDPINTDSDDVIALPHGLMEPLDGGNPNNNPLCGKQVSITYNGVTSTATVKDKCQGCEGKSIDMTRHLFVKFGLETAGRIPGVKWHFIYL
ncbi:hypothetical protein FQN49_008654 [Arthroderma sp. PD_2]|nr:hypothetical protein FQN49_008654 [Arthroderma sp. PD_2]